MATLRRILAVAEPSPLDLALADWIAKQEDSLRVGYQRYQEYYRGDHPTRLPDRLIKFLNINVGFQFADNFCAPVVDSLAERLNVTGFSGASEALSQWAWDLWQQNRADALQALVHTEAVLKGDAYIMPEWDDGFVRWHYQDPATIVPHYDADSRHMMWFSKKWLADQGVGQPKLTRLNLYYPDRIEKHRASGGVWVRYRDEDEYGRAEPWPAPWTDRSGEPLGLPIVHFRNCSLSDDFGLSELHSIIPLQDLLNKQLIDLTQILDTMAWPQRWTLNVEPPIDSSTTTTSYTYVPGGVWELQGEEAEVGQFEPADVEKPIKAIEMIVQHIAAISRMPQHLFHIGGNYPSGEALKTAEAGLVAKVRQRQVVFGNAWEDLLTLSWRIQREFGAAPPPESLLETIWEDPESRNEKAHLEALGIKATLLGVPKRQIWREMGYSQDEINRMEEDVTDQRAQDSNIGAEIIRRFSAGEA